MSLLVRTGLVEQREDNLDLVVTMTSRMLLEGEDDGSMCINLMGVLLA